jgi:hypothetical protein
MRGPSAAAAAALQYVTLQNIFLTSKFNYLLFFLQPHPLSVYNFLKIVKWNFVKKSEVDMLKTIIIIILGYTTLWIISLLIYHNIIYSRWWKILYNFKLWIHFLKSNNNNWFSQCGNWPLGYGNNSKPPRPIIMIDQSETLSSGQIWFITLFFFACAQQRCLLLLRLLLLLLLGAASTLRQNYIFLSQTNMFWFFFIQFFYCAGSCCCICHSRPLMSWNGLSPLPPLLGALRRSSL